MGFRIQNNITAVNSRRHLDISETSLNRSLERLSSGYRINSAADDAAGMASSMRMRTEIASLKVASRNAAEAVSLLQVAEGGMSQIELILIRMKELATQAASGNAGSDLAKINAEADQLQQEITRIVGFTEYDNKKLLDGSFGTTQLSTASVTELTAANGIQYIDVSTAKGNSTYSVTAISHVGNTITLSDGTVSQTLSYASGLGLDPNETYVLDFSQLGVKLTLNDAFTAGETNVTTSATFDTTTTGSATFQLGPKNDGYNKLGIDLADCSLASLNNGAAFAIDLGTTANAQAALQTIDNGISYLALARADIGAYLNRVQYTRSNLSVAIENKTASESVIRDVDMAMEMSEFTKNNILVQSGLSMLAQANQVPQSILQLLR